MHTREYDYVVVGGGIAGVCTAEMLSRSGKRVLLVEKEAKLASESSGEQHGWGQFGYLYLSLPDPNVAQACLKNIDILLNHYPLPGNNLTAEKGQLISKKPHADESWYREDPIYYYCYDPKEQSIPLTEAERKAWEERLNHVLARTKAISEHEWNLSGFKNILPEDSHEEGQRLRVAKKVARKWMEKTALHHPKGKIAEKIHKEKSDITIQSDIIVTSHDRPMRSTRILMSIHHRFKLNQGDTLFNTEIVKHEVKDNVVTLTDQLGNTIRADKVIYTSGGGLHQVENANVKTVLSPLLIVSPPICDKNLVYLAPKAECSINHLHHVDPVTGKAYSIIGNGDAVNPSDEIGIEKSRANILAQAERVFPKLVGMSDDNKNVYFGHKTEFMTEGKDRNYHFAFIPTHASEKVYVAVPGKFTLAPSLALHIYQKFEGNLPPSVACSSDEIKSYQEELAACNKKVADTLHSQVVGKRIGSDAYPQDRRKFRSKLMLFAAADAQEMKRNNKNLTPTLVLNSFNKIRAL